MRHHLVAAVDPGRDDRGRAALAPATSTSVWAHAAGAKPEPPPSIATALTSAPSDAGHHDRLLGQLVLGALDEYERGHQRTPISCRISTTFGAASAPEPRISTCLPDAAGSTSRTSFSFASAFAGSDAATGLRLARIRPGTDG